MFQIFNVGIDWATIADLAHATVSPKNLESDLRAFALCGVRVIGARHSDDFIMHQHLIRVSGVGLGFSTVRPDEADFLTLVYLTAFPIESPRQNRTLIGTRYVVERLTRTAQRISVEIGSIWFACLTLAKNGDRIGPRISVTMPTL